MNTEKRMCEKCGNITSVWADGFPVCRHCYIERIVRLARLNAFFKGQQEMKTRK